MTREALNQVRDFILGGLASGTLEKGQRLPTERELAERLGTTRATVRQALTHLEAERQVTRHVGRGTFVADTPSAVKSADGRHATAIRDAALPAGRYIDASPAELIETRQVIEPHIAELVVINATESDLKRLRRIAKEQQSVTGGDDFEESDILFHEALAQATHNELIIAASELIIAARHHPEWRKLKKAVSERNGGRRAGAVTEHMEIVEALEARNAAAAGQRMRRHLDNVRLNLLGY